jgi:hypothetical protein
MVLYRAELKISLQLLKVGDGTSKRKGVFLHFMNISMRKKKRHEQGVYQFYEVHTAYPISCYTVNVFFILADLDLKCPGKSGHR